MDYTKDKAVKSILVRAYNKCYEGEPKTDYLDLPHKFQIIAQFVDPTILIPIICVFAFIIGLGANYLSPTGKIHVLYNPIVLLILWNIIVYSFLIFSSIHRYSPFRNNLFNKLHSRLYRQKSEVDSHQEDLLGYDKPHGLSWFEQFLYNSIMPLQIRIISLFRASKKRLHKIKEQTANYTDVVNTFMEDWSELSNHVLAVEFKRLFHVGSIVLTLGAFFGIYLRGLFVEYNVIWTSTFISSKKTISMLITVIWGPAIFLSNLFGQNIIGDLNIEGLATPNGVPAAPWIHLFFISTIVFILIPRFALALWETIRIRQSIENIQLVNLPAETLTVKEIIDDRVFKTDNTINELLDYFKLTPEEQRLLFSLEYCLSYTDAKNTQGYLMKNRKFKWIKEWYDSITRTPTFSKPIVIRNSKLLKGLEEVKQAKLSTPKLGAILLESAVFNPYYPISRKKITKGLKYDKEHHKAQISSFCNALGLSEYLLNEAIEAI